MAHLEGQTALVTGGAKRIGREIALALAREGCDVAVHYQSSEEEARQTAAEIKRLGRKAALFKADLGDFDDLRRLHREVTAEFRTLDILINNASTFPDRNSVKGSHDLLHESAEEWDRSLAVNTKAPFFLIQLFAAELQQNRRGRVINMLDTSASAPFLSRAAHSISKSALAAVTKLAAAALYPSVRVNALELGYVLPGEQMKKEEAAQINWCRLEDVIAAAMFVVKSESVTGEIIPVRQNASFGIN